MAFQITDDLMDDKSHGNETQKTDYNDEMNCLFVYGHDAAQKKARRHIVSAITALNRVVPAGKTGHLVAIARFVIDRTC